MLDKMKTLMDMQKKMQDTKRELEATNFEIASSDGLIRMTMNGAQEMKNISINSELDNIEKTKLENSLKDVYNRAIRRSHDIAAEKMKQITGFNIPGLL